MNDIRLEHPAKPDEDGKTKFVAAGVGKLFINGHQVEGVLEVVPGFLDRGEVAHVTIKLAVSTFTYGPEQTVEYQFLESDRAIRIPVA